MYLLKNEPRRTEHARPRVSAFEAGFKRALKSPLCLLAACDLFQLANCRVVHNHL